MTKPRPKPKTPAQLADEHWEYLEGVVFTNMRLTMKLFKDGFTHGYRHGQEDMIDGHRVCTRNGKK